MVGRGRASAGQTAPVPSAPPPPSPRCVVGAVVRRPGRTGTEVLAARRSTPPVGRWEFPGGKVEPGETPANALAREVEEELGCTVRVDAEVGDGRPWPISPTLELRLFVASVVAGDPEPGDSHDELRWLPVDRLDELDWLPSDARALAAVRESVGRGGC